MSTSRTPSYLRRYTDLPALIHLLSERQITLLDPKSWDDENDSHFMSVYKERKKLKTLLALCFSQAAETYHHWRVFAHGPSGVCILFDRKRLLSDLQKQPGVVSKAIDYLLLNEAAQRTFHVSELPFIKRHGYKPENEFRVVYQSSKKELPALNVPISLSSIRSIVLSPWMHSSLADATTSAIQAVDGCAQLKVSRSTLVSNDTWKSYAAGAT